jgi:hypothetical protein
VLKPCSILLPHVHQNAHEFYSVIFGPHLFSALCSHTCCRGTPVHPSLVTSGHRKSLFLLRPALVYPIEPRVQLFSLSSIPHTIMRDPSTRTLGCCC